MTKKYKIPAHVSSLGEAVRYLRDQQDMSLRSLADAVGVSAPFLSDLEHGRRQTDKLDELAEALNIDVDELKVFDSRVSAELKDWLTANPKFVSFLNGAQRVNRKVSDETIQAMQGLLKKSK